MNWGRFNAYLTWVRVLIGISVASAAAIAIAKPLGFTNVATYFLITGLGAGFLMLTIALAIGIESLDVPNRHL